MWLICLSCLVLCLCYILLCAMCKHKCVPCVSISVCMCYMYTCICVHYGCVAEKATEILKEVKEAQLVFKKQGDLRKLELEVYYYWCIHRTGTLF